MTKRKKNKSKIMNITNTKKIQDKDNINNDEAQLKEIKNVQDGFINEDNNDTAHSVLEKVYETKEECDNSTSDEPKVTINEYKPDVNTLGYTLSNIKNYTDKMLQMADKIQDDNEMNSMVEILFSELASLLINSQTRQLEILNDESYSCNLDDDDKYLLSVQMVAIFVIKSLVNKLRKCKHQENIIRKIMEAVKKQDKYETKEIENKEFLLILGFVTEEPSVYSKSKYKVLKCYQSNIDESFNNKCIELYKNLNDTVYKNIICGVDEFKNEDLHKTESENNSDDRSDQESIDERNSEAVSHLQSESERNSENGISNIEYISEDVSENISERGTDFENSVIIEDLYNSDGDSKKYIDAISDRETESEANNEEMSESESARRQLSEEESDASDDPVQSDQSSEYNGSINKSNGETENKDICRQEFEQGEFITFKCNAEHKEDVSSTKNAQYASGEYEQKSKKQFCINDCIINGDRPNNINENLHNNIHYNDVNHEASSHMLFRDNYGRCFIVPSFQDLSSKQTPGLNDLYPFY